MKKIFAVLMAAIVCLSFSSVEAKSISKVLEKQRTKEYKAKVKKLNKEGWQIFGSSHTIEVALLSHYEKLMQEGVNEQVGTATSSMKNIGTAKLLQDACEKYATQQGSEIKGLTVTEHGSEMTEEDLMEMDQFLQGFESKVSAEINGELKPSYVIYRQVKTPSGKAAYEFEGYFIVDQESAHKARMKAMKAMMQEQEAMHKLSAKTQEWIHEAFDKDAE